VLCGIVPSQAGASSPRSIVSDEFFVESGDGLAIAVHHKARREGCDKQPVLLVHGTWGSAQTWDFPGRSVMDRLAQRGYDTYAVDLRGMGDSEYRGSYLEIGLVARAEDVAAAALHILDTTGRKPVIIGWSQGGMITAIVAASRPGLVAGVGLFGVPGNGLHIDPAFAAMLEELIRSGVEKWLPPPELIETLYFLFFGTDPRTGKPTMDSEAFAQLYATSFPDSVEALVEQALPELYAAFVTPAFSKIEVPTLVADGALDVLVGAERAKALYDLLVCEDKELVIFPRNAHGFFLEDNFEATQRVLDAFLAKFREAEPRDR
jgi:pimeloyl-ACP methyl ester carboxylesterase